ncbi:EpsG family protein [Pedobacter frigiditerrae]|uniref:EpsG family protein n=1 Tax=Pedobacter frigiditerrae TaxID=2530452 RepID=A0A4R0N2U0_9SPHI|nr:EpsG family protein [Pedobacter frigiditerrae]TCC94159.1 EpsG family protein [Pedobacter frigiditerrae]
MFYYIFPYLCLLSCAFLIKFNKRLPTALVFFIFLLPAILLVVLRGNIGTDTMQYFKHFLALRNESSDVHDFEPGFSMLTVFIDLFGLSARFNTAIVSAITIFLLFKSYSTNRNNILLFIYLLFPIFFYEMNMNILRFGLSFTLLTIAIDNLYDKKNIKFILFCFLALSIQYSSFIIIIAFLIFKLSKKYLIAFAAILVLIIAFGVNFSDKLLYFVDKQEAYKDLVSPSITSGLFPLLLFISLTITFVIFSTKERSNKILIVLLVLEIASFALAKVSYAGLRFQMLFLFSLIILIKQENFLIEKVNVFFACVFCIGLLGFFSTIKNITTQVESAESSYIPYSFFWEESE